MGLSYLVPITATILLTSQQYLSYAKVKLNITFAVQWTEPVNIH